MKNGSIPQPVVRRLSLYLRRLDELVAEGVQTVSSVKLAEGLNVTDASIRKDLAYFGQFGRPGVGYQVAPLIDSLRRVLGTDKKWNVVVVGAGYLGGALLRYRGFQKKGFDIVGAFDVSPSRIGRQFGPVTVQHIDEMIEVIRRHEVRLAAVAVPAPVAQDVTYKLIAVGIRGILNFAPVTIHVPAGVAIISVDLAAALEQLSFQVSALQGEQDTLAPA